MKITDVTVKRYSASNDPQAYSGGIQIVEVHTDGGVTGTGFVSASSAIGDVLATLMRRTLKGAIVGGDPLLTDDLWRRMYDAVPRRGGDGLVRLGIAAIDFALWDIKGKRMNAPVSALLGGARPRVPTYANCAHHLPPDKLAEKAVSYVKAGHRALKIRGSATYVSLDEATARVQHVREAIGPDVKLMVDVNGTWDVDTAISQLKRWERWDVYWLEEPVPPDDIPGYVRIRARAGRTYIAGGEQHVGVPEFRALIEQGAVDIVQPNAAITGGITDWLRIHALATLASVPVSPWNLQMVHIHMAAGLPNVKWIEYFMADNPLLEFQGKLFTGPVLREERTADGIVLIPPDAPGLGLALDEATAAASLVRE
ncbi:MAG: mandelate racemase/muconate lactonizing enzyme family protein [Candidatus Rokubacteria bacterium]|nr:mandelate racemase/muconate lactonizing enzyme family protein [Candidatus Rokubacteria bacterium]